MAIILEEEKKSVNWVGILTGITIAVIIFAGGYFLFFKKPELIDVVVPPDLEPLNNLAGVEPVDPQAVLNSSNFKALRDYTSSLVLPPTGRADPFRP